MSTGRNDPCPCGSGKKYKHCCWRKDRRRGAMLDLVSDLGAAQSAYDWQIDLVPLPIRFQNDPNARPALILVMADGMVIHHDLLDYPPSEPDDVADCLESHLRDLAERIDRWPELVLVRYADVAAALAARLADDGVDVEATESLGDLNTAVLDVRESMGLPRQLHLSSAPDTWAGWGLPAETVGELFRAAASFYRAAPWQVLSNEQLLSAATVGGGDWTISILGGGGQTYGLAASADIRDIWSIYDTGPMSLPFSHLYGPAISLTFVADREVPPATRREVKAARWEVADRNAQPDLAVVNTPGCGISRAQARDLVDLLWAVPRFVDQHRALLEQHQVLPESIAWRDAESGVEIEFSGSLFPEGIVTWPLPETLAPCTAEGPGAEPEAALTMPEDPDDLVAQETAVVERFERWLAERGDDERACEEHADTASSFVESFLAGYQGVPLRAVTEYDLRMFLYEWYPRKVQDTDDGAAALPGSLARFFEFVEAEEGIDCPWAAEITADGERFVDRWRACPGTFWWDEGVGAWRQLIYPDLDARLMLADDIGEGDETATGLGVVEATLERELQRRWLLWRDEAIRSGVTAPLSVREALLNRQREWERARQDALSGKTPLQAVREERQAQARRERRERADPER